ISISRRTRCANDSASFYSLRPSKERRGHILQLIRSACNLKLPCRSKKITGGHSASGWSVFKKLNNLLAHSFSLREQVEVIRSTGFGICARHVESAKRMASYRRTRAFAIDVEIADMELTDRALNLFT